MKGTVTRLRLLSLAAVVLVIAASIAVSAAPRRTTHTAAPQPVSVAQVPSTIPAAPVAPVASPARTAQVAAASVAPASEMLVPVHASAGMLIVKDPETGEIGIDPASAMIGNELNDSDEGLVEETLWDGSKMVNLQGRYQEVFVLHQGADGSRWIECSKTPSLTAKPVVAPAPAPVPQFEER